MQHKNVTFITAVKCITARDCNPGIPAAFLNPESRDCRRPNPGDIGIEI